MFDRFQSSFFNTRPSGAKLRVDKLGEADGYFIEEREASDEEYFEVLAFEAAQEDNAERFPSCRRRLADAGEPC